MKRTQISLIAPLAVLALASCTLPADSSDPAGPEGVAETQQAVQTCTSTCSAWGGNPVSCTSPSGNCVADPNGVTCDGTTIPCSCANVAVTVTTNPVGEASNQRVTWTAHPTGGSGNFAFTWVETWCFNGNAPGDCNGSSNTVTNTSPTASVFSSRFSLWDQYCVRIHDNACPALGNSGSACARVFGEGQCQSSTNCRQ